MTMRRLRGDADWLRFPSDVKGVVRALQEAGYLVSFDDSDRSGRVVGVECLGVYGELHLLGGEMVIDAIASDRPGTGAGSRYVAGLAAIGRVIANDVGRAVAPNGKAEACQRFWARLARRGLVSEMRDSRGMVVDADDIDPPSGQACLSASSRYAN